MAWSRPFFRVKPRSPSRSGRNPICLLIELTSFDKGGLERVVLDMATRLDPARFRVVIVSLGKTGDLAHAASQHGINVYDLDRPSVRRHYPFILRKERINLTNSHFSHFGYPLFALFNIPNITFIHNVYAFCSRRKIAMIRLSDPFVHTYISVSKNATRYAVRRLGLSEKKFVTIPNGLNIREHTERMAKARPVDRKTLGLDDHDYVFLNVASYNLHKGHYLMADAMKKVLRQRRDIKIVCIGNVIFPPHVDGFRHYLREQGLHQHILLPGYFPDVESFYIMADAFLLPSFIEGWSIAMNEAMFYEKPMILTRTGGAPEVIENNDIGILIDNEFGDILNLDCKRLDAMAFDQRRFKTSGQLARALMEFADHREYWREAGKRGKQKVIQFYDLDKIIREYERVFELVVYGGP